MAEEVSFWYVFLSQNWKTSDIHACVTTLIRQGDRDPREVLLHIVGCHSSLLANHQSIAMGNKVTKSVNARGLESVSDDWGIE